MRLTYEDALDFALLRLHLELATPLLKVVPHMYESRYQQTFRVSLRSASLAH